MKVQIDFEEYDNGISLKWEDLDGENDGANIIALDIEKERVIGKMILDDIRSVLDHELTSKLRLTIDRKPITR